MIKSQALLFVLFLLLLAGIFIVSLSGMWQSEILSRSEEKYSTAVFYLAQGGIERAKIEAKNGVVTAPAWSGPFVLGTGRYFFYIEDIGSGERLIRSAGEILDSSGNIIARRQIRQEVESAATPDPRIKSWSWRQE
ncbi:MAG: hypothetical protein ABH872_02680 [Candidatus Omnitrophota bacterium]